MKVAVIFNSDFVSWPMGGMITYINSIVKILQTEWEIDLWGCKIDGIMPRPVFIDGRKYSIRTNSAARTRKKWIPNVIRCFWGNMISAKKLNREGYDVLYFHLSASVIGWIFGNFMQRKKRLKRPAVILHQHGMAYKNFIGDKLNYWAMKHVDMVFFTTDENSLKRHLEKIQNPNVVCMPSSIDTGFFAPPLAGEKIALRNQWKLPKDAVVFVFSGRITEWKNPLLLSDAFKFYQEMYNENSRLIYIGTGNCEEQLRQHVMTLGVSEKVMIAGQRSREELLQLLQLSDVFVLPSKGEGVSVAAIEAMAVDLPVLAFQVEGMSGLVEKSAGHLVQKQNAEALALGMQQIVNNRKKYSPRQTALKYDEKRVGEMMIAKMNSLIKKGEH